MLYSDIRNYALRNKRKEIKYMFGFKKRGQKRLKSFDIVYKADGRKQVQGFNEEDFKTRKKFLADYHSALNQGCKVVHRKWSRKPYLPYQDR